MTTCPDCGATVESIDDLEFVQWDTEDVNIWAFKANKRLYLTACEACGAAIGGGVAGAK